jgi:hypothetical protein
MKFEMLTQVQVEELNTQAFKQVEENVTLIRLEKRKLEGQLEAVKQMKGELSEDRYKQELTNMEVQFLRTDVQLKQAEAGLRAIRPAEGPKN